MVSDDTWAIVAATALGPILAVALSLWREWARTRYARRLYVFRTLMATRKMGISQEHVSALNQIEVEFYKCPRVEAAWKSYKNHLDDSSMNPLERPWLDKRDRLLAELLGAIAAVLGFKISDLEIFKGGYAPLGWQHRDNCYVGALEYVNKLSTGTAMVPIWVNGMTPPNPGNPN